MRCYPRETQEMVFDAHDRAFALFKGTCVRGIYDNMRAWRELKEATDEVVFVPTRQTSAAWR